MVKFSTSRFESMEDFDPSKSGPVITGLRPKNYERNLSIVSDNFSRIDDLLKMVKILNQNWIV
jgi:hypothetical protein